MLESIEGGVEGKGSRTEGPCSFSGGLRSLFVGIKSCYRQSATYVHCSTCELRRVQKCSRQAERSANCEPTTNIRPAPNVIAFHLKAAELPISGPQILVAVHLAGRSCGLLSNDLGAYITEICVKHGLQNLRRHSCTTQQAQYEAVRVLKPASAK
jgi:hypothetical protein